MFRTEAPDLVVAVHPIINQVSLRVLRRTLRTDVPYATVVTDLVRAHPSWFSPQADYCMVPTEAARQRGLRYGMPPDRLEVVGQPVGMKFAAELGEKLYLRGKLSLSLGRPVVLIVGGAEGMGPVYEIARAVARGLPTAQLIIVAGRNTSLRQKLEATAWEIPVRIHGFVTNMAELMGASDVLITKAGPGTLSEALIAGLPVIISSFIPGQEEDNVQYVLEHGAGEYAPTPPETIRIIEEWLRTDNDSLRRVAENAAALARPDATLKIARRLYCLLNEKQVTSPIAHRLGARHNSNRP
jgi:1,2-diacylglycerol 3-beta-galactosyltransferase